MLDKYVTLANGVKMPRLGLGTYQNSTADALESAILDLHIELIDTAAFYYNEDVIGDVLSRLLKEGKVDRSSLFVVTKIWPSDLVSNEAVHKAFQRSYDKLKLDKIDLLLIHWPVASDSQEGDEKENIDRLVEAWEAFEEIYKSGKVRAIGVSNFTEEQLEAFLPRVSIYPMVNQYEMHPLLIQESLTKYCNDRNIAPMGYRTLGHGSLLEHDLVKQIAEKYNKKPSQILLRWGLQRGFILIPKSSHIERVRENCDIWDFELDEESVKAINGLNNGHRFCTNPYDLIAMKRLAFGAERFPVKE